MKEVAPYFSNKLHFIMTFTFIMALNQKNHLSKEKKNSYAVVYKNKLQKIM